MIGFASLYGMKGGDEPNVAARETEKVLRGEEHTYLGLLAFGGKRNAVGNRSGHGM